MMVHPEVNIMRIKIITICIIVSTLILSGCIEITRDEETVKKVETVYCSMDISYIDIDSINYTEVESKLYAHNMIFRKRNESTMPSDLIYWVLYPINKTLYYDLYISIYSNGQNSRIEIMYTPNRTFPKDELENRKEWIRTKTNISVNASNLTIDWSQAKWTVSYAY